MKKRDVHVGRIYLVRVSTRFTWVRIDSKSERHGGRNSLTGFNLLTDRIVHLSPAKCREEIVMPSWCPPENHDAWLASRISEKKAARARDKARGI